MPEAYAVNVMRGVLSVLMKHYHVRNGKAVSLKIFWVVDIEAGINIFKGSFRRKGRGIDKLIVRPVNHISRRLQAVVWLKAEIPCFVPALYLVNGKGVFVPDFTGQGTALVGTLDAFWEEKGYVTPEEYRRFCNSVVPLARIPRLVFENDEKFVAQIEAANYNEEMQNPKVCWIVRDGTNKIVRQGKFSISQIAIGNRQSLGS